MGGIQELVFELIYPFSSLLNTVLDILTRGSVTSIFDAVIDIVLYSGIIGGSEEDDRSIIDKIFSGIFGEKEADRITWGNAHKKIFSLVDKIFSMIKVQNVDLKAVTDNGKDKALEVTISKLKIGENEINLNLSIPMFDLDWVAGIGPGLRDGGNQMGENAIKKRTDSFLVIMQYIWKIVQVNKNALIDAKTGLLPVLLKDTYKTAGPFIESVLDVDLSNITVNRSEEHTSELQSQR